MPNIFDIDLTQQARELLPPDKRDVPTKSFLSSLLSPVQWCRDLVLGSYKTGAVAPPWAAGAYPVYYQVSYKNAVWYNLLDGNTDTPGTTTTWLKIQANFLGVDERVKYNGVTLTLEYALNHQFGGTFRQPVAGISDIYFNTVSRVLAGWHFGQNTGGTALGQTTSADAIGALYPFVRPVHFNINIPAALFALTNNQAITNFTRIYIPAAINFTITPY